MTALEESLRTTNTSQALKMLRNKEYYYIASSIYLVLYFPIGTKILNDGILEIKPIKTNLLSYL